MTVPTGEGFPKAARVRRRREFLALGRTARRIGAPHFTLLTQGGAGTLRLGITVSRKVGGAVVRNRVKRRIRESFRRSPDRVRWGGDLIVIAKAGAGSISTGEVRKELAVALGHHTVAAGPRRR
jgi:ribonuclease P protein component